MIGHFHLPRRGIIQPEIFKVTSPVAATGWAKWRRNPNASKIAIFALAGGGGGGNGVVGANSTAAGGGGGGSSGQSYLELPAYMLPEILFFSIGIGGPTSTTGIATRISCFPDTNAGNIILLVNAGGSGGNGSGATVGTAGAAGAISSTANSPLSGGGSFQFLVGQAGVTGGSNVTLPTTGLRVSGGAGGGALPATATAGIVGGQITGAGQVPTVTGGAGSAAATTPPGNGSGGSYWWSDQNSFWLGGSGGGSTHGSATGAGLVGGNGGVGRYGCGGGGGGGALTGSTTGAGGRGGDGIVIIFQY